MKQNNQANISRGRIAKQCGNPGQNCTVANDNNKVSNEQCVPHICGIASRNNGKNIHMNNMQENQFIHMNRFQPLSDIDLNIVNNCHSVEVNTVMADTEGKLTCNTSVACDNGVKPIEKG